MNFKSNESQLSESTGEGILDEEGKKLQIQSIKTNTAQSYFKQDQQQNQGQQNKQYNYYHKQHEPQLNSSYYNNDSSLQGKSSPKNLLLTDAMQICDNICTSQQKYDQLLLFENLQFYYKSQLIQLEPYRQKNCKVDGKLYLTEFDEKMNPKFIIQEGSFQVLLSKIKFNLNGDGIEYAGKSKTVKNKGNFQNGIFKDDERNQRSKSAPIKKIIIIDAQTGYQVNKNNQVKNQFHFCESWCKYNQLFSSKDIQILQYSRRLTSSIIDSYVEYLNIESQKIYFQKEKDNRKDIKRILFLPTTLTTNFGSNYTYEHSKDLFDIELLQFQELNYELNQIYTKVGLPVNQNNYHWYFLLFDLRQKKCTVFDSLQGPTTQMIIDLKLISTLEKLLHIQNCQKELFSCSGQQVDCYSCGYHVCQFMKYCKETQFQSNIKYSYNQTEISKILLEIIKL